jgi:hypothetical protein
MGIVAAALIAAGVREAAAQSIHSIAEPFTNSTAAQPTSVNSVLRSLASRAGLVFVGRVESIRPNGGIMEIVFAVQQRVIGEVGDTYTLREWSGRWVGGQQHYRVGQRAMVFLYAPNAAGLSSPVDGMTGVVPIIPMGADADPLLDIRWLATGVQRPVGEPIADADFGAVALADALAVLDKFNREPLRDPVKRPLPAGMRPRPTKTWNDAAAQLDGINLPSILQPQGASDVEH